MRKILGGLSDGVLLGGFFWIGGVGVMWIIRALEWFGKWAVHSDLPIPLIALIFILPLFGICGVIARFMPTGGTGPR